MDQPQTIAPAASMQTVDDVCARVLGLLEGLPIDVAAEVQSRLLATLTANVLNAEDERSAEERVSLVLNVLTARATALFQAHNQANGRDANSGALH